MRPESDANVRQKTTAECASHMGKNERDRSHTAKQTKRERPNCRQLQKKKRSWIAQEVKAKSALVQVPGSGFGGSLEVRGWDFFGWILSKSSLVLTVSAGLPTALRQKDRVLIKCCVLYAVY